MSENVEPTSAENVPVESNTPEISEHPSELNEQASPPVPPKPEEKKDKKKFFIIGGVAAVLVALLSFGLFSGKVINKEPEPAKPIAKGKYIIVPDNVDGGKPNSEKKIGEAVEDDSAPKYSDPSNLSDYRIVQEDGQVLLKSPLDGPCALNAMGNVLPPSNYLHSCYYEKNGAVIYTSHAVIGTRTGALENIQYLKEGQTVTLDEVEYKVTKVATYDAKNLPEYLLKKGTVALLTCHIDASTKSFEDFTKTDVAFLEKK